MKMSRCTSKCPLCPKKFYHKSISQVTKLHSHLIDDHRVLQLTENSCPICSVKFSNHSIVHKHIHCVHLQPPSQSKHSRNSMSKALCKLCCKEINVIHLKNHIRAHYTKGSIISKKSSFGVHRMGHETVQLNLKLITETKLPKRPKSVPDCKQPSIKKSNDITNKYDHYRSYSIYDLLGEFGQDYNVTRGAYNTVIDMYRIVDSTTNNHKSSPTISTIVKNENIINLDSDSDEVEGSDECGVSKNVDSVHSSDSAARDVNVTGMRKGRDDGPDEDTSWWSNIKIRINGVQSSIGERSKSDGVIIENEGDDIVTIEDDELEQNEIEEELERYIEENKLLEELQNESLSTE